MEKSISRNMVILNESQLKDFIGGKDNLCAALAGATLASAALLYGPGFLVFGAGFLIFCVDGDA